MTMKKAAALIFLVAVLAGPQVVAGPQDGSAQLRRDVEFLASAELEGRMTGTQGETAAVDYIAERLAAIGAVPLPGTEGLRLPFEFTAGMDDAGSTVTLLLPDGEKRTWNGIEQVQALSFSDNGSVSGELVFAGYGLSVPEGRELSYDSYATLDVKDKIVVVLRYVPEDVEQESRAVLAQYSGLRYKALHARELGAKALLVVTGPRSPNAGETVPMTFDTALSGSGIVAASLGGEVAEALFEHVEDKSLEQAQEALDTGNPHVTGFDVPGIRMTLETEVKRERRIGHNVVGYFPAADPDRADGYIVLGAHLDHLGHGNHGSSLADKEDAGKIHHGADDNASGVAALLAAAAELAGKPGRHPVVVAFWSGEEIGLVGSSRFIQQAVLPTEAIRAYVNLDMVGRMEKNRLVLQSVGSSPVWPRLIERTNVVVGFDVNTQADPYLPTDSTAFYQTGIPALHIFTGAHDDYHKPSDTADKINYEDLERVVRFASLLARRLRDLEERPAYAEVARPESSDTDRDTVRAYTGTIPDYTQEVEGLLLGGVVGDGPADQAGLQKGDIIIEFAGRSITNIYDYTFALDVARAGERVKVVFLRDGERQETTIVPATRK